MSADGHHPDEADRQRAGTLPTDPKAETRQVSARVPRVWTVRELLTDAQDRLSQDRRSELTCTTGHYRLDQITGGIRAGYSWLFGADTSFGKSSWLISVADQNLRAGKRVLICSSEDAKEIYADRLLVRRARVSASGYRDGKLSKDDYSRIHTVVSEALPEPVYVDARRWPTEELCRHLATIIREQRINVVAFDYVQEFQTKRRFQDERVKFREIASMLRHVVKDANAASILFSQLTIDQSTKIPTRRNIRECRDIANASEVILIGFEPEDDVQTKGGLIEAGTKCVLVDKVKNGPRGAKVPMSWNADGAFFETVDDPRELPPQDFSDPDRFDDYDDPRGGR